MQTTNSTIEYVGTELELFKEAINWKTYFSKKIQKHILGDVLEVGAGIGVNSHFLSQSSKISTYTLVEPDKELAKEISQNISTFTIPTHVVNGTIEEVTHKNYDTIIYIDVLEHIKESQEEIIKAKKLLKPSGKLIILVPSYNFLFNAFDQHVGHHRRYNKQLLLNEINSELNTIELYHLDSIGFFASLVNKLILKKSLPSKGNITLWDKVMVPLSIIFDLFFFYSFGKSLIGVFQKETP